MRAGLRTETFCVVPCGRQWEWEEEGSYGWRSWMLPSRAGLCGDWHGHSNQGQSSKESPMEPWEQHLEPGPTSMPQNAMHQGKEQACARSNWPLKRQVILFYLISLCFVSPSLKHLFISQRFGKINLLLINCSDTIATRSAEVQEEINNSAFGTGLE